MSDLDYCAECGTEPPSNDTWGCDRCGKTLCRDCVEEDLCPSCRKEKKEQEYEQQHAEEYRMQRVQENASYFRGKL